MSIQSNLNQVLMSIYGVGALYAHSPEGKAQLEKKQLQKYLKASSETMDSGELLTEKGYENVENAEIRLAELDPKGQSLIEPKKTNIQRALEVEFQQREEPIAAQLRLEKQQATLREQKEAEKIREQILEGANIDPREKQSLIKGGIK